MEWYRINKDGSYEKTGNVLQSNDERVIMRTDLKNNKDEKLLLSTVFLGLDHAFGEGGPVLFEYMCFGGPDDEDQGRFKTIQEAQMNHLGMMKRYSTDSGWDVVTHKSNYDITPKQEKLLTEIMEFDVGRKYSGLKDKLDSMTLQKSPTHMGAKLRG